MPSGSATHERRADMNRPNFRRMGIATITVSALTLSLVGVLAAQMGISPLQAALLVVAFIIGAIGGTVTALFVMLDIIADEHDGKAG